MVDKHGWIKVEDGLPEMDSKWLYSRVCYVVTTDPRWVWTAVLGNCYLAPTLGGIARWFYGEPLDQNRIAEVTHWQYEHEHDGPLPALPEEE